MLPEGKLTRIGPLPVPGPIGPEGPQGPEGPRGPMGPMGPMPKHRWMGTKLQFQRSEDEWGDLVDLQGPPGKSVTYFGGGGGGGIAGPQEFIDLDDVNITTSPAVDGYSVVWDDASGRFILAEITPALTLGALDDVTITTPTGGDVLRFDGVDWVNYPDSNYATSAQGTLADSALQPGDNVSSLTNDAGYLTSVSFSDIQDINTNRLLGRHSSGVGPIEELNIGGGLSLTGGGTLQADQSWFDVRYAAASHTHAASDITSGTFADARISETSVTQHEAALSVDWTQLTSVPTTFTPSAHTHTTSDITNLSSYTGFDARYYTETEADSLFAPISHTHTTSDITDLSSYTGFDSRYVEVTGDTMTGPLTVQSNVFIESPSARLYFDDTTITNSRSIIDYDGARILYRADVNSVIGGTYQAWENDGTEMMRLTHQGRLGIGTTSPSTTLHVNGVTTTGSIAATATASGAYGNYINAKFRGSLPDNNSADWVLGWSRDDNGDDGGIQCLNRGSAVRLYATGLANYFEVNSNAFVFPGTGNVGIGTTSPDHELEVANNVSPRISINDTGGTGTAVNAAVLFEYGATLAGAVGFEGNDNLILENATSGGNTIFRTNSIERVRIASSGNVGIGTTSPVGSLHITSPAPDARQFYMNATGGSFGLRMGSDANGTVIQAVDGSGGTSSYERLYLRGSQMYLSDNSGIAIGLDGSGNVDMNGNVNIDGNLTMTTLIGDNTTNLNSLDMTSGRFEPISTNFQATNNPGGGNYHSGWHFRHRLSSDYATQMVFSSNVDTPRMFLRQNTNGTWNSWYEVLHTANTTNTVNGTVEDVTTVSDSAYTNLCNVSGGALGSGIRLYAEGTTSSRVVNFVADILVNHSSDIVVKSQSGNYTQGTIRVISNANENFSVQYQFAGSGAGTIPLRWTATPLTQDASISSSTTAANSTFTHDHTTVSGFNHSGTMSDFRISSGGFIIGHDVQDGINFTATSSNNNRGLAINGRTAISADSSDGYLRLNNESAFTNGVYTPGRLRTDDNLTFSGNSEGLTAVTGQYGSVQTLGNTNGWSGYSISGRAVFMHNNSTVMGLYNDVNNQWAVYSVFGGATDLRHAGTARIRTTSSGGEIIGNFSISGSMTGGSVPWARITGAPSTGGSEIEDNVHTNYYSRSLTSFGNAVTMTHSVTASTTYVVTFTGTLRRHDNDNPGYFRARSYYSGTPTGTVNLENDTAGADAYHTFYLNANESRSYIQRDVFTPASSGSVTFYIQVAAHTGGAIGIENPTITLTRI